MDVIIELTKGSVSREELDQVVAFLTKRAKPLGWTVTSRTYGVE